MAEPARTAAEIHTRFAAAFNAKDVEGLLALYEPQAQIFPDPQNPQPVVGVAAMRPVMEQFVGLGLRIEITTVFAYEGGGDALLRGDWRLRDASGAVVMQGASAESARRQSDGRWLCVLDDPYGCGRSGS
jgi:ketosteroid isomerase-like protein